MRHEELRNREAFDVVDLPQLNVPTLLALGVVAMGVTHLLS